MKNRFAGLALASAAFFLFLGSQAAHAQDIPLLTWEKGKTQSVVLGGGNAKLSWKVFLQSQSGEVLDLRGSASNTNGFLVYRVTVPRDIEVGAYSIVTSGERKPATQVAAVQIIEMQRYEITQIPGDLLFFLLALAIWLTAAGALRGQRFRRVQMLLSTSLKERYLLGEPAQEFIGHAHKFAPLEKMRIRIYEQLPESFFKYLLKSDSRGTHLNFPWLWAQLPWLAVALAATLALSADQITRGSLVDQNLILFLVIVFIGSIDIFAGLLAAFAYFAVDVWLLSDFSLAAIVGSILDANFFFLPVLLVAFFTIITQKESSNSSLKPLYKLIFEWLSPVICIHFLFVTGRSISGSIKSTVTLEILIIATLLIGRIANSYLTGHLLTHNSKGAVVEEIEISIGRLISPAFSFTISLFLSLLFYIWTGRGWLALLLGGLICLPLFLLLVRPTNSSLQFLGKLRRQPILEIMVVALLVFVTNEALFFLPVIAELSSTLIISLTIAPVILHSIIACLSDLSVKVDHVEESL